MALTLPRHPGRRGAALRGNTGSAGGRSGCGNARGIPLEALVLIAVVLADAYPDTEALIDKLVRGAADIGIEPAGLTDTLQVLQGNLRAGSVAAPKVKRFKNDCARVSGPNNGIPQVDICLSVFGLLGFSVLNHNLVIRELDCVVEHEYFTARELVESFGEARCSEATRKAATESPYKMIDVTHMTYVRRQAPMESMASTDMPVGSVWWEPDGRDFLAKSGYESMPYFFTVWHDGGRSIYGTGPGDLARCDQRQVNAQELYKSLGLEKMIDPPLAIPGNMAGKIDTTPGARNVVASLQGTQAVMPLYSVDFSRAVQAVQQEIQIVSGRLDDILLRNVFSVPPDELLKGMTATAVVARRRAALQKMGPAINRYESRILSGVIERTYGVLASMGLIPEPPFPEAASPLQISYQSPLAEGLKQSGSDSITAFLQIAQPIIQAVPDCADKVDFDQVLDICARSLAVDPSIIRSDEDVAAIRKQKAEAQRQQMEQERQRQEMQQAAQLGSVKTEGTLAGALMGTNPEAANAGF